MQAAHPYFFLHIFLILPKTFSGSEPQLFNDHVYIPIFDSKSLTLFMHTTSTSFNSAIWGSLGKFQT